MRFAGKSRTEIANHLGISPRGFEWHLRKKSFGDLPSVQGQNKGPTKAVDREHPTDGICFGQPDKVWQAERDRIKNSWDSDTKALRGRGILGNGETPYGLQWLKE